MAQAADKPFIQVLTDSEERSHILHITFDVLTSIANAGDTLNTDYQYLKHAIRVVAEKIIPLDRQIADMHARIKRAQDANKTT